MISNRTTWQMNADYKGLTLLIPDKSDVERDAVAAAWERAGGEVLRLGRFWEPPSLEAASVRVYGNDTFGLVLAQKLGLALISPADDLLKDVDLLQEVAESFAVESRGIVEVRYVNADRHTQHCWVLPQRPRREHFPMFNRYSRGTLTLRRTH